jgi:glycosyltransferase involved in cell wall biosynthesis
MDVVHCITTIERGGAEKQLLVLIKEQIQLGMNVTVVYLKGRPDLINEIENLGAKLPIDLANCSFLVQVKRFRIFLKHHNGVLHAHLPRSEMLCFLAKKKGSIVVTRHNSEQFFPKAPKIISSLVSKYISKKFSSCIAISVAVKDHIEKNNELRKHVPIRLVYYGFDTKIPIRILPLRGNKPNLIGTVGRLVSQKDQITLIKTFAEYQYKNSESHLLIIGDGILSQSLELAAKNLGVSENITWIKNTSNPHFYMERMDLFILTSKYEGFGLVLLEAMQSGVPIIGANNSSIPEVLGQDYPGLFETGDVKDCLAKIDFICETFDRGDLRDIYKYNLTKFNPEKMAREIQEIYSNSNREVKNI